MNKKGNNGPQEPKQTKFAQLLAKSPLSLKDIERMSGVNYTTLNNLIMGRKINYRDRTLRDVAACLNRSVDEVFGDHQKKELKYNTPFENILTKKGLTLEQVHIGTGLSYSILNNLNMGISKKLTSRTKRDLIEYLETTEEELFGVTDKNSEPINESKSEKK